MNTRSLTATLAALTLTLSACGGGRSADGTPLGEALETTINGNPVEITLNNVECGLTEATKETHVIVIGQEEDKTEVETFTAAPGNQYCRFEATATNNSNVKIWAPYIRQAIVDGKQVATLDSNDLNAVTDGAPPWEHLDPGTSATITQWLELPNGNVEALIYPPGDEEKTLHLLTK